MKKILTCLILVILAIFLIGGKIKMKYVIDDMGNKYEGMTKEEILQSIGAGGDRECVFTGCITYNNEIINYNYTGNLPDTVVISKLLAYGIDPIANNLSEQERTQYIGLEPFSIVFYYLDSEIYVTNATNNKLSFIKNDSANITLFPRSTGYGYFVKSSEPIDNIQFMSEQEFNDTQKDINTFYVVTDENYVVEEALHSETTETATNAINVTETIDADTAVKSRQNDNTKDGGHLTFKSRFRDVELGNYEGRIRAYTLVNDVYMGYSMIKDEVAQLNVFNDLVEEGSTDCLAVGIPTGTYWANNTYTNAPTATEGEYILEVYRNNSTSGNGYVRATYYSGTLAGISYTNSCVNQVWSGWVKQGEHAETADTATTAINATTATNATLATTAASSNVTKKANAYLNQMDEVVVLNGVVNDGGFNLTDLTTKNLLIKFDITVSNGTTIESWEYSQIEMLINSDSGIIEVDKFLTDSDQTRIKFTMDYEFQIFGEGFILHFTPSYFYTSSASVTSQLSIDLKNFTYINLNLITVGE